MDPLIKEVLINLLEVAANTPGTNIRQLTELRLKVEHEGQIKEMQVDAYGEIIEPGKEYGAPVDLTSQMVRKAIDTCVK